MPTWTLSVRSAPESGLASVDVEVHARAEATVADLARALGQHLAPDQRRLDVVPLDGTHPWPAGRPLSECGLRTGDLIDVVTAPPAWRDRPTQTSKPRAVLRVIDGPDRGQRLHVRGSSLTLGRGPHSTMRFTDSLISQHHARIELGARPTVYDEGSANGTTVGDLRVTSPCEIDWGTAIRLGRSTVVIEPGEVLTTDPVVSVFRPPRFGDPLAEETLAVPSPPEKRRPSPLPWAMFALPVVMGLAMFMRSQTPYALVYMLAWPLVGYFGWRQQRKQADKEFAEELKDWREDVDALITTIDDQAVLQRRRFGDDYADADTLRTRAAGRDRYLWARREDRDAFLVTRLGIGTVPALLRGEVKDGGDRQARREIAAELAQRDRLDDMPVLADLAQHTLVAITGEPDVVDALARAMLLRLAFDHSPTDLSVAGCLGRARSGHETWLRWLPHASPREGGEPPVAVGVRAGSALLDHILSEDGQRAHTICLIDEEAGLSRRTVEAVAASAADRRLHLIWLGRSTAEVPAATTLLIDVTDSPAGTVNLSDRRGVATIADADAVSLEHAWRTARLMTGYVDEAAVLPASTAIPALVRLSDVCPDFADLDDTAAVIRRWSQSTGLRAQIGAGVDGVVTLDLREDGPHGLVAGTTGSGKSELLQSLICSLALNNPPSRINFLLVDYKGGAAFRECGDLPHTVGYITDLTSALVSRALTSLSAEIAAREHLLAEYGVKDLVQLERERPDAAPPSLLICVDEFAALTADVPEFVDGMVNIAQRGRSLGMHVLLATQRPAGVVTGNIRANADLRIALRMSSREDSQDVIEAPDAAHISRRTPGRAWIRRTGHGTAELVQSAWTGARQPLAGGEVAVEVSAFTAAGREPDLDQVAARLNPRTDLERCVTTITDAFGRSGLPTPSQPWLPPLPAELLLDEADLAAQAPGHSSGRVLLGRIDEPAAQRQPPLTIDLASVGHLLVHGASGSGKTELLRTAIIAASVSDTSCAGGVAPYVYGLDFAGGGLTAVAGLPTVEAVVPEAHTGRVLRLIRLLGRTMRERTHTLASRGCADLADLARTGIALPRVYVAVDNLPALVDSLESAGGVAREHLEQLQAVLQNGRRVGVHVIATVPGRGGVPSSLSASFGQRIVMRMTTTDDYLMLGVAGDVLDSESPAGAGLLGRRSVQIATTGGAGTPAQAERVIAISALLGPAVAERTRTPVPAMPPRLDQALLPAPTGPRIAVAVDADAVALIEVDLLAGPVLVAGRGRSGRTTALDAIEALLTRGCSAAHIIREKDAATTLERLGDWLSAQPEGSDSWSLVMVDDAQVWDTEAGVDADSRTARDELLRVVAEHPKRVALLAAVHTTQARLRGGTGALVDAVRQGRRGFLLQPEWNDGEVLGVTVPTKTVEPLSGPGRGLWCEGGTAAVAQLVTTDGQGQSTRDDRGAR